jgi:hypothetical protein
MSQKRKVRIYKSGGETGSFINPTANWFMQMGGNTQQAPPSQQQQEISDEQIIGAIQQGLMNEQDPNEIYDSLASQIPAQRLEPIMRAVMDSLEQKDKERYVEESGDQEAAIELAQQEADSINQSSQMDFDAMGNMANEVASEDFDSSVTEFAKGGSLNKNSFIRQLRKVGGDVKQSAKPADVAPQKGMDFISNVKAKAENARFEKAAEEAFDMLNEQAQTAKYDSIFREGGLVKYQDKGEIDKVNNPAYMTEEMFEQKMKAYQEQQAQLQRQNNPYGYNQHAQAYPNYNPYNYAGNNYGAVPTMFNPYGRTRPAITRNPYAVQTAGQDPTGANPFKVNVTKSGWLTGKPKEYSVEWNGTGTEDKENKQDNIMYDPSKETPSEFWGSHSRDQYGNIKSDSQLGYAQQEISPTPTNIQEEDSFLGKRHGLNASINQLKFAPKKAFSNLKNRFFNKEEMQEGGENFTTEHKIKNEIEIDPGALWDDVNYFTRSGLNQLDYNRQSRDNFANMYSFDPNSTNYGTDRGDYNPNTFDFRPDQMGQIQAQEGGEFSIGDEVEMTQEEIEKFLKGGGKLSYL